MMMIILTTYKEYGENVNKQLTYLWGHVLNCPAEWSGASYAVIWMKFTTKSKIRKNYVTFAVQEDILQFDVTVNDAVLNAEIGI